MKDINEKALKYYLTYREHTNKTFYLRTRNIKNRLDKGYWFQGNNDYIFTSPFKPADNKNKTQKIGFIVKLDKRCYLEFSYQVFSQEDEKYKNFYEEILKYYQIPYSNFNNSHIKTIDFQANQNWGTELEKFLYNDMKKIIEIANKYEVPDEYLFFSEKEFNKRLDRIEDIQNKTNTDNKKVNESLNQILYGTPGTGKTFSTVGMALEILGASDRSDISSIGKLKAEFGTQVEFVTFHQSFSYEDFVEGLKASSDNGKITYEIENGVFKSICGSAKTSGNNSLTALNEAIEKLKEQVTEESLGLKTIRGKDFIFSYQGKTTFRVIPKSSDKEFGGKGYKAGYPVKIDEIIELYKNPKHETYNPSYAKAILNFLTTENNLKDYQETANKKPHVLIIDEINRGNISRIFGELITLIEPSKRAGAEETISVKLPYSKEDFSVPDNLYIIGTMNTADRSLTLMDTALRRRFDFVEKIPNAKLVNGNFDGIDVKKILKTINDNIEILYDKEHLIGHSFLMVIDNIEQLRDAFKNKILPLLEEYFYDDFEKINLVLGGDSFYRKEKKTLGNIDKDIYQKQDIKALEPKAFSDIYA
ncbi:Glycerate kinase [uncultured Candidatus Thioglobus sp.]|nr:Glycerate kinase [uncultured Candidatus Thioglobus sp.]